MPTFANINHLKLSVLILTLLFVSCKWETSEEYQERRVAPCRAVCQTHGGFAYIAGHMTGGWTNVRNDFCVCQDGTSIPR